MVEVKFQCLYFVNTVMGIILLSCHLVLLQSIVDVRTKTLNITQFETNQFVPFSCIFGLCRAIYRENN